MIGTRDEPGPEAPAPELEALAAVANELARRGRSPRLERWRAAVPADHAEAPALLAALDAVEQAARLLVPAGGPSS